MDGFEVKTVEEAIGWADIVITATGNQGIITLEHMKAMKHQAILGNIGHFDDEIEMAAARARSRRSAGSTSSRRSTSSSSRTATRSSCCPRAGC